MNSKGQKVSFLALLEVLKFNFSKFEQFFKAQIYQNSKFSIFKNAKMTFLDRLNSQKFDFTQNWNGCESIKYQQSPALTSHFESFWSIVPSKVLMVYGLEAKLDLANQKVSRLKTIVR